MITVTYVVSSQRDHPASLVKVRNCFELRIIDSLVDSHALHWLTSFYNRLYVIGEELSLVDPVRVLFTNTDLNSKIAVSS